MIALVANENPWHPAQLSLPWCLFHETFLRADVRIALENMLLKK